MTDAIDSSNMISMSSRIVTQKFLQRRPVGRIANPGVVRLRSECPPDAAEKLLVAAVAVGVTGAHRRHHPMVPFGVVPEAQGRAIVERTPEMRVDQVDAIPVTAKVELVDDAMVEETDQVGARADHEPGIVERVVERARAADAVTRLEDEHSAPDACKVSGGGEAVVAGADDDHIPRLGCGLAAQRHADLPPPRRVPQGQTAQTSMSGMRRSVEHDLADDLT